MRSATGSLRSQRGFTMVEILVAMLLLLVGMLATFMLVGNANATLSQTRAREAATNLSRELLEGARDTTYAKIGTPGWYTSTLQSVSGGTGTVVASGSNGEQTTVVRRGVSYTVTATWCSVDDTGDGYGAHSTSVSWCSDSAGTSTTDPQPEDFKRVTVNMTWSFAGRAQPALIQTATFSATGAAAGPATTNLAITSPSGLSQTAPVIASNPTGGIVTFLGTSVGAADMKFFVDSTEALGSTTNNGNGTWSFNWNITTVPDGVYTISAIAADALGNRGAPHAITVKLARAVPAPAANVTGGYNYVYSAGNKTTVVELEWDASTSGLVTGYSVSKGSTTVCSASTDTDCMDLSPAASGSTVYTIRTLYTDAAGNSQSVSTTYTVTAPLLPQPSYVGNIGQATCGGSSMTITVPSGTSVAVGTRVLVRLQLRRANTATLGASDSKGNSYTANADFTNTSQDQRIVVFSAPVTSALSAGDTITVTYPSTPSATSAGVVADVLSNVATTNPVDATGTAVGNTNTASVTASSATTNANDLLVGAVSAQNTNNPSTPSGWTALPGQSLNCPGGSASNSASVGHYRVVSSTGTYTYSSTLTNNSVGWSAVIVAYKPGTAGGLLVPGPPTGLSAAAGANGTTVLTWTKPAGTPAPDFYRIYRDGINYTDRYDTIADNGTSTVSWTDSITGGSSHTYRVTAGSQYLAESSFAGPVTQ